MSECIQRPSYLGLVEGDGKFHLRWASSALLLTLRRCAVAPLRETKNFCPLNEHAALREMQKKVSRNDAT